MKSLNVKIPLTVTQHLGEMDRLNPQYVTQFIQTYKSCPLQNKPIDEFTFNYTLKVTDDLHKSIKLLSIDKDLPMNEFLGRLFAQYY